METPIFYFLFAINLNYNFELHYQALVLERVKLYPRSFELYTHSQAQT